MQAKDISKHGPGATLLLPLTLTKTDRPTSHKPTLCCSVPGPDSSTRQPWAPVFLPRPSSPPRPPPDSSHPPFLTLQPYEPQPISSVPGLQVNRLLHAKPNRVKAGELLGRAQLLSHVQLCDPVDRSPPGSSVHRILQERTGEEIAISSSRGSSRPRD